MEALDDDDITKTLSVSWLGGVVTSNYPLENDGRKKSRVSLRASLVVTAAVLGTFLVPALGIRPSTH